jgi:hypothetical protein
MTLTPNIDFFLSSFSSPKMRICGYHKPNLLSPNINSGIGILLEPGLRQACKAAVICTTIPQRRRLNSKHMIIEANSTLTHCRTHNNIHIRSGLSDWQRNIRYYSSHPNPTDESKSNKPYYKSKNS